MLNLNPYLNDIEDIEPGETRRLNHTDCQAGEDTRRRLYLTRTHSDETKVIAYCHNCQQSGVHSSSKWSSYRNEKHKDQGTYRTLPHLKNEQEEIVEPPGLIFDPALFPVHARAWYMNNVPNDLGTWWGYAYDPSTDRVYIPRWGEAHRSNKPHDLVGYQLRRLSGGSGPKYITVQRQDAKQYTFIHPDFDSCDSVVIVEDTQSALHIIRATELSGNTLPGVYINHGTRIDPTMIYNIAMRYKHVTVWLDNDNQHVINQAKLMERTIKMYSDAIDCYRVEALPDPKHCKVLEILRVLEEDAHGQH